MNWKQVCFHRVCVGCCVEPPHFMWFSMASPPFTDSENSWGEKLVRNFLNVKAHHVEGMGILPTVQRHSSGAKGMINACWCTCPGVGKWICYFVWFTTLRNVTGFFTVWNCISSKACRLSWLVMDRVVKEGRPNMWHIGDLAFTLMCL